ncbi:hypothetical protein FQN54_009633 [Arachnomyces sp. PD_36]|nr:hypothetical protein FQN54_009633 [Arachnomyces sp. PD_36]
MTLQKRAPAGVLYHATRWHQCSDPEVIQVQNWSNDAGRIVNAIRGNTDAALKEALLAKEAMQVSRMEHQKDREEGANWSRRIADKMAVY